MLKHRWFFAFALIFVFLLSGCAAIVPPLVQGWFTVTSVASVESSGPDQPVEVTVPAAACPEPTDETKLLKQSHNGYCLLYPQAYSVEQPSDGITVLVIGGLLDSEHARAHIEVEDAMGRTAEEVATTLTEEFEGFDLAVSSGMLVGGEAAYIIDRVPGQEINRQVFAVHDGRLYKFLFAPADPERGDAYTQMEELYDTVINSFTFLP